MMRTFKVPALASLFTLSAIALFGCPIYSSSQDYGSCNAYGVCCDESVSNCSNWTCGSSADCPSNSYCNGDGLCSSGGSGDGGSCSTNPCPSGFTCTLSNGEAECISNPEGGVEGGTDARTDGTVSEGGSDASEAGATDAADASDSQVFPPFTGCTSDNVCTADSGAGARCLDGKCVPPSNECSDSTQCNAIGGVPEACVQGVCTPTCSTSAASCPTGYSCSTDQTGVCTGNPTPCGTTGSPDGGGALCTTGTTCVDQHCVPICNADAGADAVGSCPTGFVCVDHGCIPDQAPQFICQTEGVQDNCAHGSICLHHNCYIACSIDAGVTCRTADSFNICKAVQTSTGTYDVCGSNSNLGSQCDLTQGKTCNSPAICIDGYCR